MSLDRQRLARYGPIALPLGVLVLGWMLLVQPQISANARTAREVDNLQQRLATVRASVAGPLPPEAGGNPAEAFERQVAPGDATSELLEQLARLAAGASVTNLLIETADRVAVASSSGTGPQVVSGVAPDPRFGLFDASLAYSPVTMSFDAQYAQAGELLWRLRDLATAIEIRSFEARPVREDGDAPSSAPRGVHVSLALFAYARPGKGAAGGHAEVSR